MHEHHRQRMIHRCMRDRMDDLADHELLEVLLYSSIPRSDTNPIAHALLERFGSLKGILEATPDELKSLPGIGDKTVAMIRTTGELMHRYAVSTQKNVISYDRMSKVGDFLCRLFVGTKNERLYLMLFNNRMNMLDCAVISDGTVNCTEASTRMIVKKAILKDATAAILAHNHPNGQALPSEEDKRITDSIRQALQLISVVLVEHFIVSGNDYWPIMRLQVGSFRSAPIADDNACTAQKFYEHFYDAELDNYHVEDYYERSPLCLWKPDTEEE